MSIAIVGAGISGLSLAHALLERNAGLDVIVLEEDNRAGGKIWTERADGFLCERGVNGFLDNRPKTLEVAAKLSLPPLRSNDNARRRFIYAGARLHKLPESPPAFLKSKLLSLPGKLRIIGELFAPKGQGDDETLESFAVRRLGREVFEMFIDPMASGIYAGDPSKLSLRSCFSRVYDLEQKYGSLIRGMIRLGKEAKKTGRKVGPGPGGILTSFHDGMSSLVDALRTVLGERVRTGAGVSAVERKGKGYVLHIGDGSQIETDTVVLACPAHAAAGIVRDMDKEIARLAAEIPYPPLTVVCLGFRKEKVTGDLNGFGFLIPGRERRPVLGTLYDSSIFPDRAPEGFVLLRSMVGGARAPEMALLDDERLLGTVMGELAPILGIRSDPDLVRLFRWERAIPQYNLGHQERLRKFDEATARHGGFFLTGNSYRGIGVNDCIENSYKLAERIAPHGG